jgi:predicted PurR-regulated permease PerM
VTPTQSPRRARSQVSLTTIFTVAFGLLLVVAMVTFVMKSVVALTLSITALMIAVALDHLVALLERHRLRRPLAIAAVTVATLGVGVGIGFIIFPPAVSQGKEFVKHVPALITQAQQTRVFHTLDRQFDLADRLRELQEKAPAMVSGAAGPLLAFVGGVVNVVGAAVTILVLAVFMLIFGGDLIRGILVEATPERRQRYAVLADKIYRSIGGYLGGLVLVCTINATLTTTFLAITGMSFYLPLGLASGFSSLIPYAGPAVAGVTISLLALVTGGIWKGLATVIYFVVYGQIEGNILSPLIFRRTVHVNPLIVTLSLLFLGEVFGIVGAVLAVPITAASQIVLREILADRRERLNMPPVAEEETGGIS